MKVSSILLLILVLSYQSLTYESGSTIGTKISVGGGFIYSNHNASFYTLSPCKTCTEFDNLVFSNSGGSGFHITSLFNLRLTEILMVELGIDYQKNNVEFMKTKFWTYTANLDKLYIKYSMKPSLDYLVLNIGPTISLLSNFNLGVHFNLGTIIDSKVKYYESLDSDSKNFNHYTFNNGKNTFAEQDVPLDNMNKYNFSLSPFLFYDFFITDKIGLTPRISYNMGLSDLQKGTNWKMISLNFTLTLTFVLSKFVTFEDNQLPNCPPGMKRDNFGNCVPIECPPGMILNEFGICDCPEGYRKVNGDCQKILDLAVKEQTKDCPPSFYYSEKTQRCEPILPEFEDNCKGAYLAIQGNNEAQAEYIQNILKSLGYQNFKIESASDIVDIRKKVWRVRTSCYPTTADAYNARIVISKIIENINDSELQEVTVEIIFDN